MARPNMRVAVVMQRRAVQSQWQTEVWEPVGVLTNYEGEAGAPRVLVDGPEVSQWLHAGFVLELFKDEAEGYYHNVSAGEPKVFVRWEMAGEQGVPELVTVSYDETSRWMDGGAQVDPVPMPADIFAWVGAFVEENYRPAPKKRIKPQSFVSPRDRTKT